MDGEQQHPVSTILLYQSEDGRTRLDVRLEGGSTWLSQAGIAELYQTTPQNITQHIRHIFQDGELEENATCKKFLQVRDEGARRVEREVLHYKLDMILAVGYRVRSARGVQFRRWASQVLGEYIVKGFALDDERLKQTDRITDYFDELLARIREIRASEARVYRIHSGQGRPCASKALGGPAQAGLSDI